MGKKERIIEQLMVTPGTRAAIADRDPGWSGGPDYDGLSQDELKEEAKTVLARGVNADDVTERAHWDDYMNAFEDALTATSTSWAPWYVIPADHKPLTQALIAQVLVEHVGSLDLRWPEVSGADHAANLAARKRLEAEP
jgi:hypothetical protein